MAGVTKIVGNYIKQLRQCFERPFSLCLSEESAAVWAARFKGKPHPFPRQRAADHCRGPGTSYHAMNVIEFICVVSPLDGGGLYALRAGRCGCDSLSLAGSRQRVKSLRSAVRLRLVFHTARQILSRSVFHSATTTHSLRSCSVSAPFPTPLPRARRTARLFLSLLTSLQSQTRQRKLLVSGLAVRGCGQFLRGRRHCPHSGRTSLQRTESALLRSLPRSHRSLPAKRPFRPPCLQSPLPDPLQTAPQPLRNSPCPGGRTLTPEALWPSATIPPSCKRRNNRCTPLEPHPVRRLPRPTALPARGFTPS